jgi:FkbM family methyltransferase
MIRVLEKGFYCLDIGANCGYYSLIMADIASESGRVAAVEANPRLASLVKQSLSINGFKKYSQVVQKAVSNTSGEKVNLVVPESASGYLMNATIKLAGLAEMAGDSVAEVETITVDELTKDWPRVDLIKIDAEGAEDSIWSGMEKTISKNKDIIIIMEFCSDRGYNPDPKTFLEAIQASGFSIQYIDYDSQIRPLRIEDCIADPRGCWDLFLQRKK